MNKPTTITTAFKAAALMGAFSLIAVSASQAAFTLLPSPTPEVPGVMVGAVQPTGGGAVVASMSQSFTAPPNAFTGGTLNSWVVNRGGGLLDFYYQVINTTPAPDVNGDEQIWRVNILHGFAKAGIEPVSVGQTNVSPFGGPAIGGLKPARTADRDQSESGDVGFEFPVAPGFPGDPLNIASGESSTFLVVRTNSTTWSTTQAQISSGDTATVATFAPVPEPGSALFGLAMFGVALTSRVRGRKSKSV